MPLFTPLTLPCGTILKHRIAKSAMSDSLGDGTGHPSEAQTALYQGWDAGGLAVSIIGEVQLTAGFAEKPGNLVLNAASDLSRFRALAKAGQQNGSQLWLQLGHAGALSYAPTSNPIGPSALNLDGLTCAEMTIKDIQAFPTQCAQTAKLAQEAGFGGVQIHAAHGFLLSQFLSPLFNKRTEVYGGSIANRMRILLAAITATRAAVGPSFPIAVKLNSSDQLEGGLSEDDALEVIKALDTTSVDLIDISGGTYFPGAKSASDSAGSGPYFLTFARKARPLTSKPLILTGGIKTRAQAEAAMEVVDVIGLARAMILEPTLPNQWQAKTNPEPKFPRFATAPEGGITAWYTMAMTAPPISMEAAIENYAQRDAERTKIWINHFAK